MIVNVLGMNTIKQMYSSVSVIASRLVSMISNLLPLSPRQRASMLVSRIHRSYPSLDFRLELAFARRSNDIVYSRFSGFLDHLTSIGINSRDVIINSRHVILQTQDVSITRHLPENVFNDPILEDGWLILPFKDLEDRTYFQVAVAIHSQRRWPNDRVIKTCYSVLYESPTDLEESIDITQIILDHHPEYDLQSTIDSFQVIHDLNRCIDDEGGTAMEIRDLLRSCKPFKIELNTGVIRLWHRSDITDRLVGDLVITNSRHDDCNISSIHCDNPLVVFQDIVRYTNLITTLIY